MSDIYKGELQDYKGNTVYPHTEADVVFRTDGRKVEDSLQDIEEVLGESTGTTSSLEVSDPNLLATSKATADLKTAVTTAQTTANTAKTNAATAQSTANTAQTTASAAQTTANNAVSALGNCKLSYANGEFFIQAGADTASKKKLGSTKQVIGSSSSLNAQTFDVKSLLPNDYTKLTPANFYFTDLSLAKVSGYNGAVYGGNLSVSYDASTGVLTVSKAIFYTIINDASNEVVINYTVACIR